MAISLWVLAVVAFMFGLVYATVRLSTMRYREETECPVHHEQYDVTFGRRFSSLWGPGKKTDVLACSAFDVPEQVTCEKTCLREPASVRLEG